MLQRVLLIDDDMVTWAICEMVLNKTAFTEKVEKLGNGKEGIDYFSSYFEKKKRGYYEGHFVLATEEPASLPKGELTRMYAQFLEDKMKQQPSIWLWSHRRWKWEYRAEFGEIYQ